MGGYNFMKTDEMLFKIDSWRIKIEDQGKKPLSETFEPIKEKNSVRVLKRSGGPISLQLRAYSPITKKGGCRHMLAHVELTVDETKEVIRALTNLIAE